MSLFKIFCYRQEVRRAWMPGAIFKYLVLPLQHVAPLDILRKQANVERQEFDLFA
jgi:hypothetical protein